MSVHVRSVVVALIIGAAGAAVHAGDLHWVFTPDREAGGFAVGRDTPAALMPQTFVFAPMEHGGGLIADGSPSFVVLPDVPNAPGSLPAKTLTVGAWVSIDIPRRWGGIAGCVQDNADYEKGWVLGYDESAFTFGLSTAGADDGDGAMTYLKAAVPYEIGRWHHVVATYDGVRARLYVDGAPAGSTDAQSGPIVYDETAPFVLGAYRDENEAHPHDGRLLEVRLMARAAGPDAVRAWYDERAALSRLQPWVDTVLGWLVEPYLTWPTTSAVSVMAETTVPTQAAVEVWPETGSPRRRIDAPDVRMLHEMRVEGLEAHAKYFYQVTATDRNGAVLEGPLRAFRTAAPPGKPFTFVAIGDTQSQPEVVRRVSDLAYVHRPNLVVHAGDLVSTGTAKEDWTGHFFPNMLPLIAYAPLMPVLGNHEQDAPHYYAYMSLPEPESYYGFTYGDAEFFMIDGNRKLGAGTDQLAWLADALAASTAPWKFAVLHQPPYTSDADDYGDTTTTTSTRGDPNVRNIIALLERHRVDICFSGHVHDYERTFPIRGEEVTRYEDGGVVYVTTAGGGGHLEDFDPVNTWFGHKKSRVHHLVYVAVNGGRLEFQAIDEHGRLFDVFELRKDGGGRRRVDHDHP